MLSPIRNLISARSPCKVGQNVVLPVAIKVSAFHPTRTRANECLQHETMDIPRSMLPRSNQRHRKVSSTMTAWPQHPRFPWGESIAIYRVPAPNPPEARHLVSRKSSDQPPLFLRFVCHRCLQKGQSRAESRSLATGRGWSGTARLGQQKSASHSTTCSTTSIPSVGAHVNPSNRTRRISSAWQGFGAHAHTSVRRPCFSWIARRRASSASFWGSRTIRAFCKPMR